MNDLNVKIQYKSCEKGEFFDERPRSLDDTLQLIKSFPWDTERGADVQLSGPGIVICGNDGSYLKVALYFNGKFSLYYLDAGNHLYEYHTPDLTDECEKVKEYFEGRLGLTGFDKHFFNIGNRAHFITRGFEYRATVWQAIWIPIFLAFYASSIVFVVSGMNGVIGILFSFFILAVSISFITASYFKHNNMYLQLSKGHDEFLYSDNSGEIKQYNKQDLKEVVIYQARNSRGNSIRGHSDLIFKDGNVLRISNMLINPLTLMSKFKSDIVSIEYQYGWPWRER